MTRETTMDAITLEAAQEAATVIEAPKRRHLIARASLATGILAAAATAATARPNNAYARSDTPQGERISHPLDYVGFTSNRIWVPDINDARRAAADIAATNANTVRIFEPYNQSQAAMDYDTPRLCNAAEAAREYNLTLEISTIGVQTNPQKELKHNYVPSNAGGVSRYLNFAKTILMAVAGPNSNKPGINGEQACVHEPLDKLIFEDFNEVNTSGFNSNQDAAKKYAYLESRAIPALAKNMLDINSAFEASGNSAHRFTLVHAIGGLAAGIHDPVGFLKDFDQELKKFGIKNPNFILGVHPYPSDLAANPADVEAALYGPLKNELDSAWGENEVSIIYDEFGSPAIADTKRHLYGARSLSASVMTEGKQAQYYKNALVEASREEGVVGGMIFQGEDESNDGWPTGVYNPDRSRKGSWNTVAQTFHDVLNGTLQK